MAVVPISIDGIMYPKNKMDPPEPCFFQGNAWISDLSVGGGPMPGGPGSQPPTGGGSPPIPTFPIWGPPGITFPPGSGYPPVAGHPLPPEGTPPAKPIDNWQAKAVWTPETGWAIILVPTGDQPLPTPSA